MLTKCYINLTTNGLRRLCILRPEQYNYHVLFAMRNNRKCVIQHQGNKRFNIQQSSQYRFVS